MGSSGNGRIIDEKYEWLNKSNKHMANCYRVGGAATLDGSWAWPADAAKHRFFKVEVAMPDGATATDAPGPVGGGDAGEL